MYNCNVIVDNRVKIFRMLIVLRLVRIFKFSTFQKGMNILLRGLSESFQALSLLLFFTMICKYTFIIIEVFYLLLVSCTLQNHN